MEPASSFKKQTPEKSVEGFKFELDPWFEKARRRCRSDPDFLQNRESPLQKVQKRDKGIVMKFEIVEYAHK